MQGNCRLTLHLYLHGLSFYFWLLLLDLNSLGNGEVNVHVLGLFKV